MTIHVNLDKKCSRCGKGGATPSGLCLDCILKKLDNGGYDHILNKYKEKK